MRPAIAPAPCALSRVLLEAAAARGFALTEDFNAGAQEGAGFHELTIHEGRRQSAADGYLTPIRAARPNLTVLTHARVQRLLLEGVRCVGVEYLHDDRRSYAQASAEVIVSAGAIDSPRLLLLSGIGPADELRNAGVRALHDLPGVGRNLHDHPICSVFYESAQPIVPGVANHAESSLLFRSDATLAGPDMQIMFVHVPYLPVTLMASAAEGFTFGVSIVPESRGALRLRDADPSSAPLIDPNYLAEASDVERLVHGSRWREGLRRLQRSTLGAVAKSIRVTRRPYAATCRAASPRISTRSARARWACAKTPSSRRTCGCVASMVCESRTRR
jgi:choline dehydrogenase